MKPKNLIPGIGFNRTGVLQFQRKMLEQYFDFLHCEISSNVLTCSGWISLENVEEKYKIRIEYVAGYEPKVTVLQPKIEPSEEIHMYRDHSICLHYPPDMPWNERIEVYKFTLPWISEWILFYEIYKITGKWEGKESPNHIKENNKNINREIR